MTKFLIGNDLHIGSKHATHTYDDLLILVKSKIYSNEKQVVLNGDIIDMANVPKKDVDFWKEKLEYLLYLCNACGPFFIRGNHELNQVEASDFAFVDGVYFKHGDLGILWPLEKALEYRAKKPGAGFLKRMITPIYDNLRHLKPWNPSECFYKAVDKIIEGHKPRAICLGHTHPVSNIDFMYKGVRILILKRGVQEIEI